MVAFELRLRAGPARACRVAVGSGALRRLEDDLIARPPGRTLVVVSDSNVAPLYAEPLCEGLRGVGLDAHLLRFPAGETSKTRQTKSDLEDALLRLGAGRDAAVVAVGGGVTGDLAGFTAATWHRGIPVVQVPTSLLAMTDAALGGKTAVNLPDGKNLVGAFHQPLALYADVATLRTLPEEEFRCGFAEAVKAAAVADGALFRWLEKNVERLLARSEAALERVVVRCLRIKGRIVRKDERDAGIRAALNFGHTVAHAVEAASGYRIAHGRAVALGLVVEARLAVDATGFSRDDVGRVEALLARLGLPATWPADVDADAVVEATRADKKARAGRARYALPSALGGMPTDSDATVALDDEALRAAIRG